MKILSACFLLMLSSLVYGVEVKKGVRKPSSFARKLDVTCFAQKGDEQVVADLTSSEDGIDGQIKLVMKGKGGEQGIVDEVDCYDPSTNGVVGLEIKGVSKKNGLLLGFKIDAKEVKDSYMIINSKKVKAYCSDFYYR